MNKIVRQGVGNYSVKMPFIGASHSTVKVTAYGDDSTECQSNGWGGSGQVTANVLCHDAFGTPVDAMFTLAYTVKSSIASRCRASARPGGRSSRAATQVTAWGPTVAQCNTDLAEAFPPNELDVFVYCVDTAANPIDAFFVVQCMK